MLIRQNRLFAYPVLSTFNSDYRKGKFDAELCDKSFGEFYVFDCCCTLEDNKSIDNLIKENKCLYSCLVECSKTKFRNLFCSNNPSFEVKILKTELCGKVDFSINIITSDIIKNFSSSEFGKDYSGRTINFDKGAFIAIGPQLCDNFPFLDDKTSKKNRSFIEIRSSLKPEPAMDVDWNEDKIIINLYKDIYCEYVKSRNNKKIFYILIQMVIVPALMEVFARIDSQDSDQETIRPEKTKWYQDMNNKYKKKKDIKGLESAFNSGVSKLTMVQDILEQPLRCAISSLDSLLISFESED